MGRFINADAYASTGQGILGNNMFAYCNNRPVSMVDNCGSIPEMVDVNPEDDHRKMMEKDLGPTGNGESSSHGGSAPPVGGSGSSLSSGAGTSSGGTVGGKTKTSPSQRIPSTSTQNSWSLEGCDESGVTFSIGKSAPSKQGIANSIYTKVDDFGRVYSCTQYDENRRQLLRIDFLGKPHMGYLPHIHYYHYWERGGRREFIFDMEWKIIDIR
jgi:hypothetical protein